MKKMYRIVLVVSALFMMVSFNLQAQEEVVVAEEEEVEAESPFTAGVDLVSSYVWRGVKYGGPALQPMVEFSKSGFSIGAWGSFGIGPVDEAVNEADLYVSYGFDFGLSLGVSDYYYQGSPYFEFGDSISSHAIEINAGYEYEGLSISANYIVNDASQGAGSVGGDMYFELGYSFNNFGVFIGAGDGWHTSTTEFEVVNIGVSASKELKITDKFSLPVSGMVSVNPQLETLNIVATISF
jgi:uncharacterized protein (TIGR02001 family)